MIFGLAGSDFVRRTIRSPHVFLLLKTSSAKQKVRRNLVCCTYEGGCHALMVGLSETYFAAFYIAVGMSEIGVGLLATVPYLLGSALQMLTPWGVNLLGSYRAWTVCTASLQGFSLLALSMLAYCNRVDFGSLLAIATIYWASGLATGPAWNTWIEFVVPKRVRARYFSVRMRACQLCLIAAITTSGLLLKSHADESQRLLIFVGLFAVAGLLRLMSVSVLARQVEQKTWLASNIAAALQIGQGPDVGKLIRSTLPFFVAMQFAVYISGPYFAPFMLKNMGLSYTDYMALILLGYFGRVLMMPWAGRIAKHAGAGRLMLCGAMGIVPMSSLWFFHQSFAVLCLVQMASGAMWASYELGMSLVFIERIPSHHRMRVLSWFNTFNGLAMVGGSMLGGLLLTQLGNNTMAFMSLFALSGLFRIGAFYWFPFSLVSKPVTTQDVVGLPWQVSSPMPNGRSIVRPFFISAQKQIDSDFEFEATVSGRVQPNSIAIDEFAEEKNQLKAPLPVRISGNDQLPKDRPARLMHGRDSR